MSASYQAVLWNRYKKQYDGILWLAIFLYLAIFIGITAASHPAQNIMTALIRAFGTLAILLLHVILAIGPISRLSNRYLPILYNRRHLGVSMFLIAAIHGVLSLLQFHSNGNVHPLVSLFTSNLHYDSLIYFPFQTLGFVALMILAAMAFTSHDFWLHFLGPKFWKVMHMLVYVAYALIVLHVALGIIQFEKSPALVTLLLVGFATLAGLHLLAAVREIKSDQEQNPLDDSWVLVGHLNDIAEDRAKMVNVNHERVAVFKYNGKLSAVHNVCKHQMGPLGEGKIVDGCITCPWHGYQYRPEDGCAPPPFTEKVATYPLRLIDDQVYVQAQAMPEGTFIEPVSIPIADATGQPEPFFIGWAKNAKGLFAKPKWFAGVGFAGLLVMAVVLAGSQQQLSTYQLDYDHVKHMEGWLSIDPVPTLKIIDGKDANGNPTFKTILLMDAFKFGADRVVQQVLKGDKVKYVKLTGYLSGNIVPCSDTSSEDCHNRCTQCITGTTQHPVMEIENGVYSFEAAKAPIAYSNLVTDEGMQTLTGEIIDPKCYFGAMNPGEGKPHLSCAVRCISGGIMPVLKYTSGHTTHYAFLVGTNGEKINSDLLQYVGLPVQIKGHLSVSDHWGVFRIDQTTGIQIKGK